MNKVTEITMMRCDLCGREAAETLITLARWETVEDQDGRTRRICPLCWEQHQHRTQRLLAALRAQELRSATSNGAEPNGADRSFVRAIIDSVIGR
jgi:hypothetical protein